MKMLTENNIQEKEEKDFNIIWNIKMYEMSNMKTILLLLKIFFAFYYKKRIQKNKSEVVSLAWIILPFLTILEQKVDWKFSFPVQSKEWIYNQSTNL